MQKRTQESKLVERANSLIAVRRFEEAAAACRQALATSPEAYAPLLLLSHILELKGDYEAALEIANRAVRFYPDRSWAHAVRARALVGTKQCRLAPDAARTAVRLAPDNPQILHTAAYALGHRGYLTEARVHVDRLLQLRPVAWAFTTASAQALKEWNWHRAEADARKALAMDPREIWAWNNLGFGLSKLGRRREAIEALIEGARLAPDQRKIRNNLHNAFLRPGRDLIILWALFLLAGALLAAAGGTLGWVGIALVSSCLLAPFVYREARLRRVTPRYPEWKDWLGQRRFSRLRWIRWGLKHPTVAFRLGWWRLRHRGHGKSGGPST